MPHKTRAIIAAGLQLVVLLAIAGERQWTLARGTVVLLETAPVDPRDLFRGDYVILAYKISNLNPGGLGSIESFRPGQVVYVGLEQRGKYWEAVSVGTQKPSGIFLRGRTGYSFREKMVSVRYGIESYFVPHGRGRAIEQTRDPVAVEVAVGRDGTAVIRRLYIGNNPFP